MRIGSVDHTGIVAGTTDSLAVSMIQIGNSGCLGTAEAHCILAVIGVVRQTVHLAVPNRDERPIEDA